MRKTAAFLLLCLAGLLILPLRADNEIWSTHDSTGDPNYYVIVGNTTDQNIWDVCNTTWTAYYGANDSNYALVSNLWEPDRYFASVPPEINTALILTITEYKQSGSEPNLVNDRPHTGHGEIHWDGTCEVSDTRKSSHEWYVSTFGSNSNSGHSPATALLTIAQALSNASNYDTIYLIGDFDETVDLDTANKSIILDGCDGKGSISRTGSGQRCIIAEDDTVIRKLRLSTTSKTANSQAIYALGKSDVRVEDCDIFGAFDGICIYNCKNVFVTSNIVKSNYDSVNLSGSRFSCNDNFIYTDSTYANNITTNAFLVNADGNGVISNNVIKAEHPDSGTGSVRGISLSSDVNVVLSDNLIIADGEGSSGNVYALYASGGALASVDSACLSTQTSNGGTMYDIAVYTGAIVNIQDSIYDTSKLAGTVNDYSRDANAVRADWTAGGRLNAVLAGVDSNTANIPTASDNATAVFAKTGITEGGTWTYAEIVKLTSAWMLGQAQEKTGDTDTTQILDAEDGTTVLIEYDVSATSPYKEVTIP